MDSPSLDDPSSIPSPYNHSVMFLSCNHCNPVTQATYFLTNDALGSKEKSLLLLLSAIAFLVNLTLALSIILSRIFRKQITYIFVVSLTTTQLLITSSVIPMYCLIPGHPVNGYLTALAVISYITNLSAVTHDRFVAITQPFYYHERVTQAGARVATTVCWLTSVGVTIVPVLWDSRNNLAHKIYLVVLVIVFLLFPLLYICTLSIKIIIEMTKMLRREKFRRYGGFLVTGRTRPKNERMSNENSSANQPVTCVIRRLRRSEERGSCQMHSEIQLAVVCLILIFVYGATWTPVLYMTTLTAFDRSDLEPANFSQIAMFLLAFNALVDPVLYGLGVKEVRRTIYKLLCRKGLI